MINNKPSILQKERRLKTRWQIPDSLDAKVIIWTQQAGGDSLKEIPEQFCQGHLSNICELGAQIKVERTCWEQLHANQSVKLQLDVTSCETEIKTEINGQVKYIVPDERENKIKLGIEFSETGLNAETKQAIFVISESSGACSECAFDECPNL